MAREKKYECVNTEPRAQRTSFRVGLGQLLLKRRKAPEKKTKKT